MTGSATASVTLPADDQIMIVREFDAPRELVFRAWTEPDLVRQWWQIDLRPGGSWRYVMVTPDGTEVGFHGEYREVVPGERIVQTEIYDPFPGAAAVDTLAFEDLDGRTRVTMLVQHSRKEHRDAHVESGMEEGLQDALDLLEGVAQSLA
jgi:uncharacterized protein YndB with AHSA1/START domain